MGFNEMWPCRKCGAVNQPLDKLCRICKEPKVPKQPDAKQTSISLAGRVDHHDLNNVRLRESLESTLNDI